MFFKSYALILMPKVVHFRGHQKKRDLASERLQESAHLFCPQLNNGWLAEKN